MSIWSLRNMLLLSAGIIAASNAPVMAKPLGPVASVKKTGSSIEILTSDNEILTIESYGEGILRVRAGQNAVLTDAGDKAAKIAIANAQPITNLALDETNAEYVLVLGKKFSLRIYRDALRLEAWDAANKKLIWKQLSPLDLSAQANTETLSSTVNEQFFGGGQQNGNFAFKGKVMEVNYSGGWEEGDRPNPAPFFMSSAGYGVLRNTWKDGSYDFRSDDYLVARHKEDRFDSFYIFGAKPADIVRGFTDLTGRAAKLPRWGYEYGDADCYNDGDNKEKPDTYPQGWSDGPTGTTPDVLKSVAAKYREHDMPGGWILPNDGYGCGYTQLPEVVKGLAGYGFKTGLWTENGVDKIAWEVGTAGTRVQKLDVAWTGDGYQFALDANQSAANGILNNSDSRPLLWTVMGWAGIQRYAVTWTGDQSGSWDYIRWHIPTYIGSGLSGQAYATSDVDGIFGGSPETFTRDLQWKAFTPVLMGMSGWSKIERKHPWWFEEPYRSINRRYLKLRNRLMPYLYTLANEVEQSGAPIVRGLVWDHPNDPNALNERYKYQFFYGKDFLVAPVYRSQSASGGWRPDVHLPEGRWVDYWDGRVTDAPPAGRLIDYQVALDNIPVLVRAGAIIPMYPDSLYDGQVRKTELSLDIYPHGTSKFTLYEDDGNTRQYQKGAFAQQEFAVTAPQDGVGTIKVDVGAIAGNYAGMEPQRAYRLQIHTRYPAGAVSIDGVALTQARSKDAMVPNSWYYDSADRYGTLHILTALVATGKAFSVLAEPQQGAQVAATASYPTMPPRDGLVPVDAIKVVSRPLEEAGQPVEKAFDGKPETWFRTSRDMSLVYGAPEFTLLLGGRRAIDGFDIAPRNDENWKYSQVKDYEIYIADNNGEWGKPAHKGQLAMQQGAQTVRFAPVVGRLMRLRVLSVHDPDGGKDPMVLAADQAPKPLDPRAPISVGSFAISEFRLHEFLVDEAMLERRAASELGWTTSGKDRITVTVATPEAPLKMNGVAFSKGFGTLATGQINLPLTASAQTFRADVGIDDRCAVPDGIRFKIIGDGQLLFDSGSIKSPAVVKPEIDVRGIARLSLLTEGTGQKLCANWANATITGVKK